MLGENLGSLLYGDVSVMNKMMKVAIKTVEEGLKCQSFGTKACLGPVNTAIILLSLQSPALFYSMKWNLHIRNVCSKATRTLGFLRRNLFSCPQDVKEAVYKSMVRPILEYGSTVWDPHFNGLNDELENVQKSQCS